MAPDDAAIADKQFINAMHQNDDGMDFNKFCDHQWDNGTLIFKIQLNSGQQFEALFTLIKKDRPIELAKYIQHEVIEPKRGGYYEQWAKNTLKRTERTIR